MDMRAVLVHVQHRLDADAARLFLQQELSCGGGKLLYFFQINLIVVVAPPFGRGREENFDGFDRIISGLAAMLGDDFADHLRRRSILAEDDAILLLSGGVGVWRLALSVV